MNILRIAGRIVADYTGLVGQVEDALDRADLELYEGSRPLGELSEDDLFQLSVWLDARIEGRGSPAGLPKDVVLVNDMELALLPITDGMGDKIWIDEDGEHHRENGPAIIYPDGAEYWYNNGKLHREGGPAVTDPSGYEEWWDNGKLHRENGPAIIHPDGVEEWYKNGMLHREDGPAIIYPDGVEYYYLNGEQASEEAVRS